jgi:hypothetical protein
MLNFGALGLPALLPNHIRILADAGVILSMEEGDYRLVDSAEATDDQKHQLDEAIALAGRIWESRESDARTESLQVRGSGTVVPLESSPSEALLPLGFVADAPFTHSKLTSLVSIGLPIPSTPAEKRDELGGLAAAQMASRWHSVLEMRHRLARTLKLASHPFARTSPHPQPGQAIASQSMYSMAAFSHWLNSDNNSTFGRIAVGLTAAAAYWLPAGQTASFAESEPLDDQDRAELTLPFPQVFLAFAEPLLLEPSTAPTSDESQYWGQLSATTHDALRDDVTVRELYEARDRDRGEGPWTVPHAGELIGKFGAQIEGILLLADRVGRPDDLFAWCLTIPGAYGAEIGRFAIPASRGKTKYRDVVDNLTAVVAWAHWHEPDAATEVPLGISANDADALISSPAFRRDAKRSGAGIRVIDVGSTNRRSKSPRSLSPEEPDTHVTPHIRRGHWRRQRFGSNLEHFKRIRIAPVLVNAHRGDVKPRVYRLRLPKADVAS